jgi:hypothetical protein
LEPIKDKCLGYGSGNHEEKAAKYYNNHPAIEVANRLGVKYMGYSALATLIFDARLAGKKGKVRTLRVFIHHGFGGGRTHGAQINKVEQFVMSAEADIYAMGHVHGDVASKTDRLYTNQSGKPIMKGKAYVITSSFQEAFVEGAITYAEVMGFRQSSLASPIVKFRFAGDNNKLEMKVDV